MASGSAATFGSAAARAGTGARSPLSVAGGSDAGGSDAGGSESGGAVTAGSASGALAEGGADSGTSGHLRSGAGHERCHRGRHRRHDHGIAVRHDGGGRRRRPQRHLSPGRRTAPHGQQHQEHRQLDRDDDPPHPVPTRPHRAGPYSARRTRRDTSSRQVQRSLSSASTAVVAAPCMGRAGGRVPRRVGGGRGRAPHQLPHGRGEEPGRLRPAVACPSGGAGCGGSAAAMTARARCGRGCRRRRAAAAPPRALPPSRRPCRREGSHRTAWMTWTTSHSPPLAEWTVDSVSQSSSSDGGPGELGRGRRRVEHQIREQARSRRVAGGGRLDLLEIGEPGLGVVVAAPHDGVEELPQPRHLRSGGRGRRRATRPRRRAAGRRPRPRRRAPPVPPPGAAPAGWARRRRRRPHTELIGQARRGDRPDAVEEAPRPPPGQLVPRVVEHPQQRQQVLHVGGLEEPQAAVLHVRDVAAGQFQLEQVGVPGGAEQHGLAPQIDPLVAVGEHPVGHRGRLVGLVAARPEQRATRPVGRVDTSTLPDECPGAAVAITALATATISGRGPMVGLQAHERRRRVAHPEVEDVAGRRRPEAVDGLGVVADHGETPPVRAQGVDDVGLQDARVLVLVDQHGVERRRRSRRSPRRAATPARTAAGRRDRAGAVPACVACRRPGSGAHRRDGRRTTGTVGRPCRPAVPGR